MSTSSVKTKLIKGLAAKQAHDTLVAFEYEAPLLGPWDIEVEITHCGICHSDLHLINNDWGNASYPLVPGHEIIGHIVSKGALVDNFELGQRVGIGWQRSSCLHCDFCRRGDENLCLLQEATCLGHFGGFAQAIVADSRFAFTLPTNLASENAAPLLCGGATVFSPFVRHDVRPTMRVGVIGVGGLGHLAIQFAAAFGCEVTAFSTTPAKEAEARFFGAHHFVTTQDKRLAGSFDFILSSVSAAVDWEFFIQALRPKGTLCLLGALEHQISTQIFQLVGQSKAITGSNIGSRHVIDDMLRFAALHNITAKTELFPMAEANVALAKLAKNQIHYRAVLHN